MFVGDAANQKGYVNDRKGVIKNVTSLLTESLTNHKDTVWPERPNTDVSQLSSRIQKILFYNVLKSS